MKATNLWGRGHFVRSAKTMLLLELRQVAFALALTALSCAAFPWVPCIPLRQQNQFFSTSWSCLRLTVFVVLLCWLILMIDGLFLVVVHVGFGFGFQCGAGGRVFGFKCLA